MAAHRTQALLALAALALGLGAVAPRPALAQAAFDNAVLYNAGTLPESVAVGDLDGDQDADLVVVNRGGHYQILFNTGTGTFATAVAHNNVWPSDHYTVDVRMADLDRDGDNDLVAAYTSLSGSVSILRNNGNGTFAAPSNFDSCYSTQGLTVGDFNGDLHKDIAGMTNCFRAVILVNDGNAVLRKVGVFGDGYNPNGIDSADLDNDGDRDIVYSNGTSTLTVLRNDGHGVFPTYDIFDEQDQPQWIALADYDHDGDNDIAVANLYTNDIAIYENDGLAHFTPAGRYAVGTAPKGLVAADLDNDGDLDLVAGNSAGGTITIRWNAGNGTFPTQTTKTAGAGSDRVVASDVNGDARLDIVAVLQDAGKVAVYINRLSASPDSDNDGVTNALDCAPSNAAAWAIPTDVGDLLLSPGAGTKLSWSAPDRTGTSALRYDLLRSTSPSNFLAGSCVASSATGVVANDATVPSPLLAYLVRARSACGGTLGSSSTGVPRAGASCP
jgi:hypothetical protein